MNLLPPIPSPTVDMPRRPGAVAPDTALRAAARELEAGFLAEMLKAAGLGKGGGAFGGGVGEDQFASLLLREQAALMVDGGGIGLSEAIFEALKEQRNVG